MNGGKIHTNWYGPEELNHVYTNTKFEKKSIHQYLNACQCYFFPLYIYAIRKAAGTFLHYIILTLEWYQNVQQELFKHYMEFCSGHFNCLRNVKEMNPTD